MGGGAGTPAVALWRDLGFREFGRLANYSHVGDQRHEGLYMVRDLTGPRADAQASS